MKQIETDSVSVQELPTAPAPTHRPRRSKACKSEIVALPSPIKPLIGSDELQTGKLVYIVDDEPIIADYEGYLLESAGYEVKAFQDRELACQAFLAADRRPDLLITDYRGYPITAEELMTRCRQVHPGLKILMASGWPEQAAFLEADVRPDRFLAKPYAAEKFLEQVRLLAA